MHILFRPLGSLVPPYFEHGIHWQVEAWPEEESGHPAGVAWVVEYTAPVPTVLEYLLVADEYRRRGVATALVAACRERWPGLWLTDAISEGGAALRASLPEG